MKFMECPYCKKDVGSLWSTWNTFWLFSSNKQCKICENPIALDVDAFAKSLIITWSMGIIILVAGLLILRVATSYSEKRTIIGLILIMCLVMPVNYIGPYAMGKFFSKRLFVRRMIK